MSQIDMEPKGVNCTAANKGNWREIFGAPLYCLSSYFLQKHSALHLAKKNKNLLFEEPTLTDQDVHRP